MSAVTTKEENHGGTRWVALRSRGADWSFLTPTEAAELGRAWVERYGQPERPKPTVRAPEPRP